MKWYKVKGNKRTGSGILFVFKSSTCTVVGNEDTRNHSPSFVPSPPPIWVKLQSVMDLEVAAFIVKCRAMLGARVNYDSKQFFSCNVETLLYINVSQGKVSHFGKVGSGERHGYGHPPILQISWHITEVLPSCRLRPHPTFRSTGYLRHELG
jgi:hypothetical protein